MGEKTKISWTGHTQNFWTGCRKVSGGCKNCYAERIVTDLWKQDFRAIRRAPDKRFNAPLGWKEPAFVFTCSMSDFFIEEADAWRDEAWEIIRRTPHLTYQILTKRPERIAEHLPRTCFSCGTDMIDHLNEGLKTALADGPIVTRWKLENGEIHECCDHPHPWPWPNVWLGTSVENQKYAEIRIPQLVSVPAKVHFLSCEPLLGSIDFGADWRFKDVYRPDGSLTYPSGIIPPPQWEVRKLSLLRDIEWVIVGGESGPDFRPMDPNWAREIRDQCAAASVPFFYKQSSGPRSEMNPELDGREWREMPRRIA